MEVDEEVVENEANLQDDSEDIRIQRYVRQFLDMLKNLEEKDQQTSRQPYPLSKFHSVLCFGRNSDRLRLISFIFASEYCIQRYSDVHLIRADHMPDLVRPETAFRLIETLEDASFLEFLHIYYLYDQRMLINHLLDVDNTEHSLVPGAIILDDISSYVLKKATPRQPSPLEVPEPNPNEPPPPNLPNIHQIDINHDRLYTVFKLCSSLNETANFCGTKLTEPKQKCLLIVTIDLNNFLGKLFTPEHSENIPDDRNPLIQRICERFFRHQIYVDTI